MSAWWNGVDDTQFDHHSHHHHHNSSSNISENTILPHDRSNAWQPVSPPSILDRFISADQPLSCDNGFLHRLEQDWEFKEMRSHLYQDPNYTVVSDYESTLSSMSEIWESVSEDPRTTENISVLNSQPSNATTQRKRKVPRKIACVNCRRSHTACNGGKPCTRCTTLQLECSFEHPVQSKTPLKPRRMHRFIRAKPCPIDMTTVPLRFPYVLPKHILRHGRDLARALREFDRE